jgi:hypothetical protein
MPAIIRTHVAFAKADDSDALFRANEITTAEASELTKLTPERIRQLCKRHGVGRWEGRLRLYIVDRQRLADHLARSRRRRAK